MQQEICEVAVSSALLRRGPDSNSDLLYLGRDLGCHLAIEVVVEQPGRFSRVDALDPGLYLVDLHVKRVAGRVDAAADIDHARNLGNPGGNPTCRVQQRLLVICEQLDLDRLRHRSEVADQVFHQLRHLDAEPWHILHDLGADLPHDLVDRPSWPRFEAHEEIALVRLGEVAAETGTGAARPCRDFRGCGQNGLDLANEPIRLG